MVQRHQLEAVLDGRVEGVGRGVHRDLGQAQALGGAAQDLRLAKIALNAATDALYSSTNHGMELMALNHVYGPEPKEGIASFQEKRPADWRKFREGQGPEPEEGAP